MSWQESYRRKQCTAEEAAQLIRSGDRVMMGQMHGVSQILIDAICARRAELMDVTMFSSMNFCREPYIEEDMRPHLHYLNGFIFPLARKAYQEGRLEYLQMFFQEFPRWVKTVWKPQVAIPVLTPPDEEGYCSYSMNADFIVAGCECAERVIAHINPLAPRTAGARIHVDQLACAVVSDQPLLEIPMGRAGEAERQIAAHIAERIPDGACLQLGIGGLPDTVLSMLSDKKDLGIHTELFSDGVVAMYEKGIITGARKQIDKGKLVTTSIIGTKHVHQFAHNNPDILMMPVDYTNDPYIIAQNDNVVSVNACLEVDLLGQVNADHVGGEIWSGIGGQVDFVRGANISKGGQSFISLPSTAVKGTVSRIVPRLQNPVTTSRHDVRSVVTEFGIADLFGRTLRERAEALIAIAHPDFRADLRRAARELLLL